MAWCPNYDLPKRVLYELYLHRNGTFKDICADLERHNVPAGTFEDMTSLSECLKMTKRDSKITPAADVLIGLADRWLEGDIRAAIGDH